MSNRLYRLTVLGGVLTWLMVGIHLHAVLRPLGTGESPARLDVVLLTLWGLLALLDLRALLGMRIEPRSWPGVRATDA